MTSPPPATELLKLPEMVLPRGPVSDASMPALVRPTMRHHADGKRPPNTGVANV